MKKVIIVLYSLFILLALTSCEGFVTNVDKQVDKVEDKYLNDPSEFPFMINGVKINFAEATDQLFVCVDGLSDQMFFNVAVPNATYPTFDDIDRGEILLDNSSVAGAFNPVGFLRYTADDLLTRVAAAKDVDEETKKAMLFNGNFYGGIARYYYATYFGLTEKQGGGAINLSKFIPSAEMNALAIAKFTEALKYASDAEKRVVNSFISRVYLFAGDYANAATYAKIGMKQGDAAFAALYSLELDNYYWQQAGNLRSQYVADFRIKAYIDADPAEANRISIAPVTGSDKKTYYKQTKYPNETAPIPCYTWQENNLVLAELALRGQATGDAKELVNAVRKSHNIAALANVDLDVIYAERDKELFCQGNRLPDQRRFGKFHLAADKWQFLPITERERLNNPNL